MSTGKTFFFFWFLLACIPSQVHAQSSDDIEAFSGDMPLIVAIDHAGWKIVGSTQVGPSASDTMLREFTYRILLPQIFWKTGCMPYYICQQGRRDYVNTNRAVGDPEAYGSRKPYWIRQLQAASGSFMAHIHILPGLQLPSA